MGRSVRRADLWPLLRYSDVEEPDGTRSGFFRLPYLLPLHGLEPDGWDRHYQKLFEVYGASWLDGERRSSLLFPLSGRAESLTGRCAPRLS